MRASFDSEQAAHFFCSHNNNKHANCSFYGQKDCSAFLVTLRFCKLWQVSTFRIFLGPLGPFSEKMKFHIWIRDNRIHFAYMVDLLWCRSDPIVIFLIITLFEPLIFSTYPFFLWVTQPKSYREHLKNLYLIGKVSNGFIRLSIVLQVAHNERTLLSKLTAILTLSRTRWASFHRRSFGTRHRRHLSFQHSPLQRLARNLLHFRSPKRI